MKAKEAFKFTRQRREEGGGGKERRGGGSLKYWKTMHGACFKISIY